MVTLPTLSFLLKVDGAVNKNLELTYNDLEKIPGAFRVSDISKFGDRWRGAGVSLKPVLDMASPSKNATHVTFHAEGDFAASIPLREAEKGILIYKLDNGSLERKFGGPVRFVVPEGTSECNNVKSLIRIEVTVGKGKDTTPKGPH